MFTLGTHATYDMPGWIRYESGTLIAKVDSFVVEIPTALDYVQHFRLYAPAEGHKTVNLKDLTSCEVVKVPVKGQKARIAGLFEAVENRDWNQAKRLVRSLANYHAKLFALDVWQYEEDKTVPYAQRREGEGIKFVPHDALTEQRRHCYAVGIDHKLVKLTGASEEDIEKALDALTTDGAEGGTVEGLSVREDAGMKTALEEQVLPHYAAQGFVLAGGSPDAGLMLFVRPEVLDGVNSAESAQRAAKIMLRGGVPLRGNDEDTIAVELVDFESGEFGTRDGIFMVIDNRVMAPLARKGGVAPGFSYQGHYIDEGVSMMKGMVYSVGPNCSNPDLQKLLASSEIPAVVDINIYNKVIDDGSQVGDVVTIDPNKLWVMESDRTSRVKTVRLSAQVLERAGGELKPWLNGKMSAALDTFVEAVKAGEFGELLSPFTRVGKLARAGIPAFAADRDKYEAELARAGAEYARKGARIKGADARLFMNDHLSVDVTDGEQIPGASVPESWGLKVGDRFLVVAYPALNALDSDGRNTCIFVVEVEEVHAAPHIQLHGDVAGYALRDEDGDKLICILPEEDEDGELEEVPAVGQARIKLSTRLSDEEAAAAGATAARKREVFRADISTGSLAERSAKVFDVYMRLGAQVGIVDNMVTSIQMYLGDRMHTINTPTGESATIFTSKCIQASIEGMKHLVDDGYSMAALRAWLLEILPEAFEETDSGYMKFKKHPALAVRKAIGSGESTLMDHLKALNALRHAVQSGVVKAIGEWGLQVARFAKALPYYTVEDGDEQRALVRVDEDLLIGEAEMRKAKKALRGAVKMFFADHATYYKCSNAAAKVRKLATQEGQRALLAAPEGEQGLAFWKAETKALRLMGMRMRFGMRPAERLAIDVHWLHEASESAKGSKRLKTALHAGSQGALELLGRTIREDLTVEDIVESLGMNGRNQIRGDADNKAVEYDRTVKHAAAAAALVRAKLKKTDGIAEGDVVTAGAPGIKNVRLIVLADGERRWLADESVGEFEVLHTKQYVVKTVDHDTKTMVLS